MRRQHAQNERLWQVQLEAAESARRTAERQLHQNISNKDVQAAALRSDMRYDAIIASSPPHVVARASVGKHDKAAMQLQRENSELRRDMATLKHDLSDAICACDVRPVMLCALTIMCGAGSGGARAQCIRADCRDAGLY